MSRVDLRNGTKNILDSEGKESIILSSLLKNQKLLDIETKVIENLAQNFEFLEIDLGHKIPLDLSADKNSDRESQYLYLVCQGRIRLLGYDKTKQREVAFQLLTEGDVFGGDLLLDEVTLSYQAIAADRGQLARINLSGLEPYLIKTPELKQALIEVAKQRQQLLFFKTLTSLRMFSSRRLELLLPVLKEAKITAGENLERATPAETGRFWLKEGAIGAGENPTNDADRLPNLGDSWGYPEPIPTNWIADSDLAIYKIAKSDLLQLPEIFPSLAGENGKSAKKIGVLSSPKSLRNLNNVSSSASNSTEETASSPTRAKSVKVDFPKPFQKKRRKLLGGFPFIEQQSSSDCGVACLAMISQYWGKRFSINNLRNLVGVGRSGASLKGLSQAAESLGYLATPVRASFVMLIERTPWIAHWQGDHYVVVYEVKGNSVYVADPALGKKKISRQEFLSNWSGYALLLEPTIRFEETETDKRTLSRYFELLWRWRSVGWQIIFASLLVQVFGLVTPLLTQIILDRVVVNKSLTSLHVFALGALLFGLGSVILNAIRQYLLSYLSNRLDLTSIAAFINHTFKLPLTFFASRQVGDIITRVQENQKIQRFLVGQVLLAWLDLLTGFVYGALMFYYNWQLALMVLALIPPIAILTLAATPFLRQISREVFKSTSEQQSSLVEILSGVEAVKGGAVEQEVRWRWEELLTRQLNIGFKGQKLAINLGLTSGIINTVGTTALLWFGAFLVIQNSLTIGQFVAFNMMISRVISPAITLANLWDEMQEVLISVERLNDVFDTQPEELPDKPTIVLPRIRGEVSFEKVTFAYDRDAQKNTLQNISFTVRPGQTIAIVGRSGSGKTTLVKLLQGLYYPTSGSIFIDAQELRHISLSSLRSQLGVVPQECFLFSGTILDNISLFRSQFSLDQVIEAAKLAEAHGFIQGMPLGYNTKVGERGANLSGGQRQRIAIARALLGDPRILILDEATSSLDTESERRFQENLSRLSRERTVFIIAHRLSTVRNADSILVLDRGILAEQGTHSELMSQKGLYYYLAQQQLDL